MRKLLVVVVLLAVGAGATWVLASRAAGPLVDVTGPDVVGQTGALAVAIETPGGQLRRLDVVLEQGDGRMPVFSLVDGDPGDITRDGENRLGLTQPIGKQRFPELRAGSARIVVTAVRPVLFGLREATTVATRDIDVRLDPPQVGVQSAHHFINHGGSEMVVYRTSAGVGESGVRVGEYEYPGFPAAGAGIAGAYPNLRVAFFALLWDQDVNTPIEVFARDELGNEGRSRFDYRVFPKNFRNSRITLDDGFLSRVVPAILQSSPGFDVSDPSDLLAAYLRINRDMRRDNNAAIAELRMRTSPTLLWQGPFKQLINTAVESGFADQRVYLYNGEEVDRQVHLGFDLASTARAAVLAANRGEVVHAGWLGIYGNCVILDHGMGLQSLYAHLSSMDVEVGQRVETDGLLGHTGTTGLAGGDHLHFTMLLHGNAITPIDWWSGQWVEDRILRKLGDAGASSRAR